MFILPWVYEICGDITIIIHLQSKKQKVEAALTALSSPAVSQGAGSQQRVRELGASNESREPAISQGASSESESQEPAMTGSQQ